MEAGEADVEGRLRVIPHSPGAFTRLFLSCDMVPVIPVAWPLIFFQPVVKPGLAVLSFVCPGESPSAFPLQSRQVLLAKKKAG